MHSVHHSWVSWLSFTYSLSFSRQNLKLVPLWFLKTQSVRIDWRFGSSGDTLRCMGMPTSASFLGSPRQRTANPHRVVGEERQLYSSTCQPVDTQAAVDNVAVDGAVARVE